MCVVMIEVLGSLGLAVLCDGLLLFLRSTLFLAGKFLIKEIAGDIMKIHKLHACGIHYLAIPLAITVIATLYLACWPLITRGERNDDRCSTLLTSNLDKLLKIPSKTVNEFGAAVILHLIYMTGICGSRQHATLLLISYRTDIIMSELQQYKVAGTEGVIHLFPS